MSNQDNSIQDDNFKAAMLAAFQHGKNFKLININQDDLDINTTSDKNLSFYEWFNKHYE